MLGLGCRCCKVLMEENKELREYIDRLISRVAPRPVDEVDTTEEIIPEE